MTTERLALLRPSLPTAADLLPSLERINQNASFTNFGPLCQELEAELACLLTRGKHPVRVATVSSGTAGLELSLTALGLNPGAKVLLPALTFPATATAIVRAGCQPVFADVDPVTWHLTPVTCEDVSGISAVLPVAIFGRGCDPAAWDQFTAATGVPVIMDAAGAFGNQVPGLNTSAVFSLHATKSLAAGEGGFVATSEAAFAERVRQLSNFGYAEGTITRVGTNAKLSEYHAAIALAALKKWPVESELRKKLALDYQTALSVLDGRLEFQAPRENWVRSVFVARFAGGELPGVMAALAEHGIETRRWYWPPLHRHPAFQDCPRRGPLTTTERLADELLGLPFHLHLPAGAPERVAQALKAILT